MTAKEDPARHALAEVDDKPLLSALIIVIVMLRHVYLHVPKAFDSRNVAGMLGKALAILEIVQKEMEIPIRRDD